MNVNATESGAIDLRVSDIHLWLTNYSEIEDEVLISSYRELMSESEREQEPRFYFARDQRRYLLTRALVRTVLSRYVSIGPKDWTFTVNAYGRPEASNIAAQRFGLAFNISHTHNLIVLAVTRDRAVGVDVENILVREVSLDLAKHYFAPLEISSLAAAAASQQQIQFYEYWTFKESYIKARGMGLSIPLHKFGFRFRSERTVEIEIDADLADDPRRWQFWQFRPSAEYLVAVCAERCRDRASSVEIRQIVPLSTEKTLMITAARTST